MVIPRLHPNEETLACLCVILGPTAAFTVAGYHAQAAIYVTIVVGFDAARCAWLVVRTILTIRRRRRLAKWHQERVEKLLAEKRFLEAAQAFVEWREFIDSEKPRS